MNSFIVVNPPLSKATEKKKKQVATINYFISGKLPNLTIINIVYVTGL